MSAKRKHGHGSLRIRGDKWVGQWWSNGKQVARTLGPVRKPTSREGLTEVQAEKRMRDLQGAITPRADVAETLTINKVGALYVAHLKHLKRKPATIVAVESALRVHIEPFFEGHSINSITHAEVNKLMQAMETKGVGPKSIRNYIGTLGALYRFSMHPQRKYASANPCEGIVLPGVPDHEGIRFLRARPDRRADRTHPRGLVRGTRPSALQDRRDDGNAPRRS